jgi:hypothetical protein
VDIVQRKNLNAEVKAALESEEYIMFLHDDLIFYDYFSLDEFIPFLRQIDTYVSATLHLGFNVTHIRDMLIPPHELREQERPCDVRAESENILSWGWNIPVYSDYFYPIPLCSTVYKTEMLLKKWDYVPLDCATPNEIEISLNSHAWPQRMLSYKQSVCYQIMDNQVYKDRGILDQRMTQFDQGHIIDVEALNAAVGLPKACAFEHPIFLKDAK